MSNKFYLSGRSDHKDDKLVDNGDQRVYKDLANKSNEDNPYLYNEDNCCFG